MLRTVDYYSEQSRLLEYNLTLDQELPWSLGLAVAYAGSRGFDLPYSTEGNPRVPQILPDGRYFWPAGAPRINPNWDDVLWKTTGARSWYNSLQISLLFTIPQRGFLGNSGHNAFRGPGFANVNLALVKDNSFGGTRRLELRVEVFNLLNRVNLALPSRTVFSGLADVEAPLATAGRITATNSPARQLQVSSRITF